MNTTNYENSKKLAEIGFLEKSKKGYFKREKDGDILLLDADRLEHHIDGKVYTFKCLAFDLETILNALPNAVDNYGTLTIRRSYDHWIDEYFQTIDYGGLDTYYHRKGHDESLADTAARLLIKLVEQKIINFNKSPS